MHCRHYRCSKLLAVLIALLSVAGLAVCWWSPNGFQHYRERHRRLDYRDAGRPGLGRRG